MRELQQQITSLTSDCQELRANIATTSAEKAHLEKKVQKSQQVIKTLQAQLAEEKQISSLACNDKVALTTKNAELEKLRSEVCNAKKLLYIRCAFDYRRSKNLKSRSLIS